MKFGVLSNGSEIAKIKWCEAWSRYALFPRTGVMFDSALLKEVANFINGLMEKRKFLNS